LRYFARAVVGRRGGKKCNKIIKKICHTFALSFEPIITLDACELIRMLRHPDLMILFHLFHDPSTSTIFFEFKNCEICDYNRKIMGCDRSERMVRDAFTMMMSCKSHHHKNYDNFYLIFLSVLKKNVSIVVARARVKFRNVSFLIIIHHRRWSEELVFICCKVVGEFQGWRNFGIVCAE
jgi:hypothetical protein